MEIRDLYDVNRLPTGLTGVRGEKPPEGCYHTVIHTVLFDAPATVVQKHLLAKLGALFADFVVTFFPHN